jgi:acyl-CoA reductase-like NAD-dependent aldehyde dehydrogenase
MLTQQVTTFSTFEVTSPLNHKTLYRSLSASGEDVQKAIVSAQEFYKSWSLTRPGHRRDIFLRAAEELKKRRYKLRQYSYNETGAAAAMFGFEYAAAIDLCVSIAGLIQIASNSTAPLINEGSAVVVKEPYGVVLAIAPWNAPHILLECKSIELN